MNPTIQNGKVFKRSKGLGGIPVLCCGVLLIWLYAPTLARVDERVIASPTAIPQPGQRIEPSAAHHEHVGHESAAQTPNQYSLFMHHTSGAALLVIGTLPLGDRLTHQRYRMLALGMSFTWLLLGLFLFIKADPEGWPIGPAGLLESFQMPTAGEWLQHKILSLVPVLLGAYSLMARGSRKRWRRLWKTVVAVAAAFGAVGLIIHQHADHPGMDIVNLQHRLFALTGLFIAASLVAEDWAGWGWSFKSPRSDRVAAPRITAGAVHRMR